MNVPPLEPDDLRLTAYALGEVDETERSAVEKMLAESPPARAEVEQTQAIARSLAVEYAREQAHYLASRQETGLPTNVVAFRNVQRRPWHRATGTLLKIAAVAAVSASLVYLTLQRTRRPEVTIASAPPSGSAAVIVGQATTDKLAKGKSDENPAASIEPQAAPPALDAAAPPPSDADAPQEMKREGTLAATAADQSAGGLTPGSATEREDTLPALRPEPVSAAPAAASSTASAARRSAKAASPDEQIARSVVRIRTAGGAFSTGIIVSANGLILSAVSAPQNDVRQPCAVFLADQREFSSVVEPSDLGSEWRWLHIDADGLPTVSLATDSPARDASLVTAQVDPQTGALALSHFQSANPPTNTRYAFTAAGELVVVESAPQKPATITRAQAGAGSSAVAKTLVRPFTRAERAMVRQTSEKKGDKP